MKVYQGRDRRNVWAMIYDVLLASAANFKFWSPGKKLTILCTILKKTICDPIKGMSCMLLLFLHVCVCLQRI